MSSGEKAPTLEWHSLRQQLSAYYTVLAISLCSESKSLTKPQENRTELPSQLREDPRNIISRELGLRYGVLNEEWSRMMLLPDTKADDASVLDCTLLHAKIIQLQKQCAQHAQLESNEPQPVPRKARSENPIMLSDASLDSMNNYLECLLIGTCPATLRQDSQSSDTLSVPNHFHDYEGLASHMQIIMPNVLGDEVTHQVVRLNSLEGPSGTDIFIPPSHLAYWVRDKERTESLVTSPDAGYGQVNIFGEHLAQSIKENDDLSFLHQFCEFETYDQIDWSHFSDATLMGSSPQAVNVPMPVTQSVVLPNEQIHASWATLSYESMDAIGMNKIDCEAVGRYMFQPVPSNNQDVAQTTLALMETPSASPSEYPTLATGPTHGLNRTNGPDRSLARLKRVRQWLAPSEPDSIS